MICVGRGWPDLRPVGEAEAVRRGFRERDRRGLKPREQDEVSAMDAISVVSEALSLSLSLLWASQKHNL